MLVLTYGGDMCSMKDYTHFPFLSWQTLVFCSGQICYELLAEREKRES